MLLIDFNSLSFKAGAIVYPWYDFEIIIIIIIIHVFR
jgi:hypothetical protein